MTLNELTDFAGGFVEYCEDANCLLDTIIDMGFGDTGPQAVIEFEAATGVHSPDLLGRHWALIGNRVFVADE